MSASTSRISLASPSPTGRKWLGAGRVAPGAPPAEPPAPDGAHGVTPPRRPPRNFPANTVFNPEMTQ